MQVSILLINYMHSGIEVIICGLLRLLHVKCYMNSFCIAILC